jgi:hypothetical protein
MVIRDLDASSFRNNARELWDREARALDAYGWLEAVVA